MNFILASNSPRRKEILNSLIEDFDVISPSVDESVLLNKVEPLSLPKEEAKLKAEAIIKEHPSSFVLAADTMVFVNDKPLGKPKDKEDAIRMLSLQSGNKEKVITGFAFYDGKNLIVSEDITIVEFNTLSKEKILDYIQKYQPFDKAGAYGIQDEFGLIKKIEGSYYNVMGLPKEKIEKLFREKGIV